MDTEKADRATGRVRIVSRSSEPFADRVEAGKRLASTLSQYKGKQPVVLGIPRGGVVVAREIALALDGALDVVLAHKLGTPGHEELAMGAIAEDGTVFMNENVVSSIPLRQEYLDGEKERQLYRMRRRTEMIRSIRPKVPIKDRVAIVTDDGVATGATTQAALWAVRLECPALLIAAVPVGPEDTIRRLSEMVDEIVCLRSPEEFFAVGQFYRRFDPVEDEEMLRILAEEQAGHR
jgi:putative phosphoribosyl transferase